MKLIVKKLQGGECTVEVQPTTYLSEVKRQVAKKFKIPIEEQKLLYLGRALSDEQTVKFYKNIKDGSKLNLIVKRPEGLYDVALKAFKKTGMSDVEAKKTTKKFLTAVENNLNKLSWDDIERLVSGCLAEESNKPVPKEANKIVM